ncbi:MAG: hypothetical protein WBM04_07700 [Candidatus Korobacteraceae bacterium]
MLLFAAFIGCKPKPKAVPETVMVLRNLGSPYASEMDRRIVEFQITNPRTTSGKPIVIRTVEIRDYPDLLQNHLGKDAEADVIILDKPSDADLNPILKADMANAVNICAAVKACPAEVPAMVASSDSGDRKDAAQQFVDALQKKQQ